MIHRMTAGAQALRKLFVVAAVFGSPVLFGATVNRQEAQAQILEQNSFPCPNCFFGKADYFFCFATSNEVMTAHTKVTTLNWEDSHRNFLGKIYHRWRNPTPSGQSLTIQYDNKHVWMPRSDGKRVRLTRERSHDVFTNPQCRSAEKPAASD